MSTRHRILFWDVETSPMLAYIWRLKTEYVNPDAVLHEPFLLTWAAKFEGEDKVHRARLTSAEAKAKDDRRIVDKLGGLVGKADMLVAHNGDRFDLPKLNTRLASHQLDGLPPVPSIDTLKLAKKHFTFASNRLDYISKQLGFDGKLSTGFDLWKRAYAGDTMALRDMDVYCQHDVVKLEEVFQKLRPYVKLPRLVNPDHAEEDVCLDCGSPDRQLRGWHHTAASAFRRAVCTNCGKWRRVRKSEPTMRSAGVPL